MLPLSSERYEQFRDFSLLIRKVSFRDLGPYTCQAYNGYVRAYSLSITVQAIGPVYSVDTDEVEFRRYLLPAPQPDPRAVVTAAPTPAPPVQRPRPVRPVYVDPFFTPTTVASVQRPALGNGLWLFHFGVVFFLPVRMQIPLLKLSKTL